MTLFDLCLKYKTEKNPLEKTIKYLLNSIYHKSILKLMTYGVKVDDQNHLQSLQPPNVWSFGAVMSTAKQNNIDIYYEDTEGLDLKEWDFSKLMTIELTQER